MFAGEWRIAAAVAWRALWSSRLLIWLCGVASVTIWGYSSRAADFDPAFTCNYHLYRVVKPFNVEAGPIAPGFGQRGLGLQFQLVASLLPGTTATANVAWLLNNGYLQRMTPGQCGDYPDCRE